MSPYFILEQINILILRREVVVGKATQALVVGCPGHQSARESQQLEPNTEVGTQTKIPAIFN